LRTRQAYVDEAGTVTFGEVEAGNMIIAADGATVRDTVVNGNVIIAPAVGNGEVTLHNVHITGKLIIMGGGSNTINITGNSIVAQVQIEKSEGSAVRLFTDGNAAVATVIVTGGSSGVVLDGYVNSLVIETGTADVTVNGTIDTLVISAPEADVTISETAVVQELFSAPEAVGASISLMGTVAEVTISSPAAEVFQSETAQIESIGFSGAAVGAVFSPASGATVNNLVVNAIIEIIAEDDTVVIVNASLPTEVTVVGTTPETVTSSTVGSINDLYTQ